MSATEDAQREIAEEFSLFDSWADRYQYLIDLGRKLPPMPEEYRNESFRIQGCQSQVWLVAQGDADRIDLVAGSDSAIVSGLVALVLRVYSGRSAQEIVETEPHFVADIGLSAHLSPTRTNGLAALLDEVKRAARARMT